MILSPTCCSFLILILTSFAGADDLFPAPEAAVAGGSISASSNGGNIVAVQAPPDGSKIAVSGPGGALIKSSDGQSTVVKTDLASPGLVAATTEGIGAVVTGGQASVVGNGTAVVSNGNAIVNSSNTISSNSNTGNLSQQTNNFAATNNNLHVPAPATKLDAPEIPVGLAASAISQPQPQATQDVGTKLNKAELEKTEAYQLGWLSPLSREEFKKQITYVPQWNESQPMIPLEKRVQLVQSYIEAFKLARAIVEDSYNTMKFFFSAKVLAYYTPRIASLMFRHKLIEHRLDIPHGYAFYSSLINLLKDMLVKSKQYNYSRGEINIPQLKRRQMDAINYTESVMKNSPVLENLDWRKMDPPIDKSAVDEAADIMAQMRANGHSSILTLIESIVTLLSKLAAKELTQNFDDLPAVVETSKQSSAVGNLLLSAA